MKSEIINIFKRIFFITKIKNFNSIPKKIIEKMHGFEFDCLFTDPYNSYKKVACMYSLSENDTGAGSYANFYFVFTSENNPQKKKFALKSFEFCALVVEFKGEFWARKFNNDELEKVKSVVLKKGQDSISDLGLVVENITTPLKFDNSSDIKKEKINLFVILVLLPFLIMIAFPIHPLLLDIFILLSIVHELLLLLLVCFFKNIKKYSLFPSEIILSLIFNLAINIKITSLILLYGSEINVKIIKELSSLINNYEKEEMFFYIMIFILFIIVDIVIINKKCIRLNQDVSNRFTLDSLQVKLMSIENEYISGVINKEDIFIKKERAKIEGVFLDSLYNVNIFISSYKKIKLFIIGISFIYIIFINILQNGRSINDIINTYLPLIITNGILFILLSFLTSLTMGVVFNKRESLHGFPY